MLIIDYKDARDFQSAEVFRVFYEKLPDQRRQKLDRIRHEKTRLLSMAAGVLLHEHLEKLGFRDSDVILGEYGKPFLPLEGAPFFSLSHAGDYATIILADRPVGIDMEKVHDFKDNLAERFFLPEEAAAIKNAPNENECLRLFFKMWTMKEAYGKLKGDGLQSGLSFPTFNVPPEIEVIYPRFECDEDYIISAVRAV